ncbi:hypothetical protein AB7M35_003142 [Amorphus suaedae]
MKRATDIRIDGCRRRTATNEIEQDVELDPTSSRFGPGIPARLISSTLTGAASCEMPSGRPDDRGGDPFDDWHRNSNAR